MMNRFVMKCGGSTLAALPDRFYEGLKRLQAVGAQPVIVHGGGPAINETLAKLGIESRFVNGLRVTTEPVLDVVEMVLAGQINKAIVQRLQAVGAQAMGISGTDGGLLTAKPVANSDEIGFVGQVTAVKTAMIDEVCRMGYIPVIAPLGIDASGQRYNINADTAAGAVTAALGAERLVMVTDVPGILRDGKLLPLVTVAEVEAMIASGEIYGGMIPKVKAALDCLAGGVDEVVIVGGKEPDVLAWVLGGDSVGTRVRIA
ncbi:MAG TPA: acetylglutamate kinase [Symbiobacteriaceae bacterium]|nr:acetylglutamate kinase [Symbiobacteriaceae bacterium]